MRRVPVVVPVRMQDELHGGQSKMREKVKNLPGGNMTSPAVFLLS
jgi:hypothetical protein